MGTACATAGAEKNKKLMVLMRLLMLCTGDVALHVFGSGSKERRRLGKERKRGKKKVVVE